MKIINFKTKGISVWYILLVYFDKLLVFVDAARITLLYQSSFWSCREASKKKKRGGQRNKVKNKKKLKKNRWSSFKAKTIIFLETISLNFSVTKLILSKPKISSGSSKKHSIIFKFEFKFEFSNFWIFDFKVWTNRDIALLVFTLETLIF